MLRLTRILMVVGIVVAGLTTTAVRAVDHIVAEIRCPTVFAVDHQYPDKVGSDPKLSRDSSSSPNTLMQLEAIGNHGQELRCLYKNSAGYQVSYKYTAKRKIVSCEKKKGSQGILECRMEK